MDIHGIMGKIEEILEDSKTGVLATVDTSGRPHMRWMTPAIVHGRPGAIFAVTSPQFAKAIHLASHSEAEWMLQTRALDEIVNIKCKINLIDNPSIKSEILEAAAKKLTAFWKVNTGMDFIVLETILEEAAYYNPMKGLKEVINFSPREEE